jgi:hypothetical protein
MRLVTIDDANYEEEYRATADAIRDFLYMYFEISGDCLPVGDWDRAELGSVDPFRYLDVAFEYEYLFRPEHEIAFLHEGAAVNLLCRLAQAVDTDECSGSRVVSEFGAGLASGQDDASLRKLSPELHAIYQAHAGGRVVDLLPIQAALSAGFTGNPQAFYSVLETVRTQVIIPVFASQAARRSGRAAGSP